MKLTSILESVVRTNDLATWDRLIVSVPYLVPQAATLRPTFAGAVTDVDELH